MAITLRATKDRAKLAEERLRILGESFRCQCNQCGGCASMIGTTWELVFDKDGDPDGGGADCIVCEHCASTCQEEDPES